MGFNQTSVLCHSIEEQILDPENLLNNSLNESFKLLKKYISDASDSDSFLYNSFDVHKLFEFAYLGDENFKLKLYPLDIGVKEFLLLRKIFTELIKNSIAHSNLNLDDLRINIHSKLNEKEYEFEYDDNSNVSSLTKSSKVSILSGRGVGLISVYDLIKDTAISIESNSNYQYRIKLGLN
jgi:hypothetical protein